MASKNRKLAQRQYRKRRFERGLCQRCQNQHMLDKVLCKICTIGRRLWQRKYIGGKEWKAGGRGRPPIHSA